VMCYMCYSASPLCRACLRPHSWGVAGGRCEGRAENDRKLAASYSILRQRDRQADTARRGGGWWSVHRQLGAGEGALLMQGWVCV